MGHVESQNLQNQVRSPIHMTNSRSPCWLRRFPICPSRQAVGRQQEIENGLQSISSWEEWSHNCSSCFDPKGRPSGTVCDNIKIHNAADGFKEC